MKKMRISLILAFLISIASSQAVYAVCPAGFAPVGRFYHPDDNTHALVIFQNYEEQLILEPSFTGDATDFGLILPLPSKPELNEAPEKLFQDLEDLTNPFLDTSFVEYSIQSENSGLSSVNSVRVIEQKDVGDFTTTTLTATSKEGLIEWLKNNKYNFEPTDEENFDYYVNKGGYFFVAMKVNMKEADIRSDGTLKGKLKPISFRFETPRPMLPLRSMAGNMEVMSFTLYTMGNDPYYIPGSEIAFSKKLTFSDLEVAPSLFTYDARGQWLVRNHVSFDPKKIKEDFILERGNNSMIVESANQSMRVNPDLLSPSSGIIESKRGKLTYLEKPSQPPSNKQPLPVKMIARIVTLIFFAIVGVYFYLYIKKRRSSNLKSSGSALTNRSLDKNVNIVMKHNVIAGTSSAVLTILAGFGTSEIFKLWTTGFIRLEELHFIFILILIVIIFSLTIFGPAVLTASKHGWKSFVTVILIELIVFLSLSLLFFVFPVWKFIPYLT